jgi:DNA-binding transcriptional MerR regulator
MEGYVYFLHDLTNGAIKIGASADPESRMSAIQSQSLADLVPLRYLPTKDMFRSERMLHHKFSTLRIKGEWFRATPELLAFAQTGELNELPPDFPVWEVPSEQGESMSLAQLAERSGVSGRTIRYYIAERVLHPPKLRGPSSYYDQSHLSRLKFIAEQRAAKMSLHQIARLGKDKVDQSLTGPIIVTEHRIGKSVTVQIRGRKSPQTVNLIKTAMAEFAELLSSCEELTRDISQNGEE